MCVELKPFCGALSANLPNTYDISENLLPISTRALGGVFILFISKHTLLGSVMPHNITSALDLLSQQDRHSISDKLP